MQTYTPENPEYSESIPVVESTDAVSAANANAAVKKLMGSVAWLKDNAGIKGFVAIPTVTSGTEFTYDGTEKELVFADFDENLISVTSGAETNAGDYTAILSLKNTAQYMWKDMTTEPKMVEWKINKAAGAVTISANTAELDADHTSVEITVTSATGKVSVTTSDDEIAEATVSGNVITITSPDSKKGTATISVNVAESDNYEAATAVATIDVTASFSSVWGAEWDGTSTTAWSRTDAAAEFTDPVPYVSGATNYGSPFDDLQPWAGMVKEERTGGTMVKIPKFWYKLTQNGNGIKVQISDGEQEGFSVSPAHMDRGDGKGERDAVYVGRYHCGSSAFKSVTGQTPKNNTTRANFRTSIHNLGSDIWQLDFATRFTIWLLYIVEFANWNSQEKIGYGCGNNSGVQAMGYTDSMPYHTGTTQSSRTTYGLGTQYRNIEGLWDNVYDWCDGCYYNSNGLNIILDPSKFSDSANGTAVGVPSSGYPSKFTVKDVAGAFPTFIPTEANGSESTYSCDGWVFVASYPCLYVGGYYNRGADRGMFCVDYDSASSSSTYRGSRLLELP